MMKVTYRSTKSLPGDQVLKLYRSINWSAARRPARLLAALRRSDSVVSAWVDGVLVGLGNAISDHGLVVYYPHLLVLPEYQNKGIGREIMKRLMKCYRGFHQHILIAEFKAAGFYRKCGFTRAGKTVSMWIFTGTEHG